jgi:inosose dehydratase
VKLSATPGGLRRGAPVLGQHTREILAEIGYATADVDALVASGAALDGSAAEHLERQRRVIDYAAELGAGIYCMLGADRVWQRLPNDDELARLGEQAERLIDYAAPHGITVCYHAHPRCTVETEAEQDRLLAFAGRLKICLDVSVSVLMEEDPVAQLRKYRDRVGYVHMKDVGPGKFCPMGRGTRGLDFGACLAALEAIDYRGWVVGELSNYADTEATASCRENREFLRSLGY